ncbi:Circadian clock-controlled protein [Eumeta japonica]|uniref:Circadian clock-controlled protein n=1 Tax=Eumeta variegata TaxID=151549 RepID=A0A4C1ZYX7_EUMVA|nr:Circadian clock-controlled protein [Eumeta japonica]
MISVTLSNRVVSIVYTISQELSFSPVGVACANHNSKLLSYWYSVDAHERMRGCEGNANGTRLGYTDYFPQCKRSDPQIEKCILSAVDGMRDKLRDGIPEVNAPALDPFNVPTLRLDRTAPNLKLKAVIKNMKAYGGKDFRIEKLKLNLDGKYLGEVKIVLPKLDITADYDVKGSRVLVLDIDGKGKMRANFTGITVVAKGNAKPILKDGVQYLQADKVITKVKIGHGQVAFDDVERPVAATSAATFFNASPNVVLDILNPLIEETGAAILKAFLNKILGTVPINEILIDDSAQ